MKKEDCFELGIISRLFSFKGEVILFIDSDQPEKYHKLDSLFLEINKQLIPFFITKSSVNKSKELRIRFEGVDTEEQASRILKKKAYLPIEVLPELDNKHFYYHEIEGFELVDSEKGNIGSIITVLDNPGNMLLEVDINGVEALIPLNDHTFIKVDRDKKQFFVTIPEGLLDIYK